MNSADAASATEPCECDGILAISLANTSCSRRRAALTARSCSLLAVLSSSTSRFTVSLSANPLFSTRTAGNCSSLLERASTSCSILATSSGLVRLTSALITATSEKFDGLARVPLLNRSTSARVSETGPSPDAASNCSYCSSLRVSIACSVDQASIDRSLSSCFFPRGLRLARAGTSSSLRP